MSLVFRMGEFEAIFPTDRLYAKNHMWALEHADGWRFGFAAYAVRLLQDVYFLDWEITAGMDVREGMQIGDIESSKAESSLHAPLAGKVLRINSALLKDPSAINSDKYGDGWLFEIATDTAPLLEASDYLQHLKAVWEVTQKTIKGQLNG